MTQWLNEAREFWRLPEGELGRLLALARDVGQVQLKLLVREAHGDAACAALGVELGRGRARRVYYLDTPDLELDRHGVVVRIRSIEGKGDDSVVKLRPFLPDGLPGRLRRSKTFVVEIDAMPGSYVCSGAAKARLGKHDVARAVAGRRPLGRLFSKQQLALLAVHAPMGIAIEQLDVLGPIDVLRHKATPKSLDHEFAIERWTYPDGSHILELSTRCTADRVVRVAAQTAAALRAHGVQVASRQQSKTHSTLDFFSDTQPAHGAESRRTYR